MDCQSFNLKYIGKSILTEIIIGINLRTGITNQLNIVE